ncbi:hypothetical protein [Streptomyces sp. NPDC001717]|uniref:hypothetical protein n=1 Tax=Streptomyces sp. NPDC001717 TaxID=3364604 RepID=UPI0036B8E1FC
MRLQSAGKPCSPSPDNASLPTPRRARELASYDSHCALDNPHPPSRSVPPILIHQRHGHELPLTERLAELDDEYDILEYGDRTVDQVNAEVTAEARRIAAHPTVPRAHGFAQLVHTDRPASSR